MRSFVSTLNSYSGLLQAVAAIVVAVLTVLLIRWNRKYVQITERMFSVASNQAEAALQQTSILKQQWDHAKEARILLRVPLWTDNPLSLEIVNVGEPTIVVRRILVDVPVTTHSTSAINIDPAPTIILPTNAVQLIDLD